MDWIATECFSPLTSRTFRVLGFLGRLCSLRFLIQRGYFRGVFLIDHIVNGPIRSVDRMKKERTLRSIEVISRCASLLRDSKACCGGDERGDCFMKIKR